MLGFGIPAFRCPPVFLDCSPGLAIRIHRMSLLPAGGAARRTRECSEASSRTAGSLAGPGNDDSVDRLGQPQTRPEGRRPIVTSIVSPRVPAPRKSHCGGPAISCRLLVERCPDGLTQVTEIVSPGW